MKKAVAKLRNEEGREVVDDPSPRSRKKHKSDALAKVESFVVSPDAAMKGHYRCPRRLSFLVFLHSCPP